MRYLAEMKTIATMSSIFVTTGSLSLMQPTV